MTDSVGTQIGNTVKYLPFGEARNTVTIPTDKLFTGQRLDSTGLYYYNARYYDPTIGRFISPDTIIPNPTNPQSFNRYSYCYNNPLKFNDPSGHGTYEDMIALATLNAMGYGGQFVSDAANTIFNTMFSRVHSPMPSFSAFTGISFGPITINGLRRNIIADVTLNKTGGIPVAESSVSGIININENNKGTTMSVSLFGNNNNRASDLHSSTTIVPNNPILSFITTSGKHGQVGLMVPQGDQSYFAERNRNSPEYWLAFTSGNAYIPPIKNCSEMTLSFTFHTADPGGWDWEGQPSFTRPYGFEFDLITNQIEILEY